LAEAIVAASQTEAAALQELQVRSVGAGRTVTGSAPTDEDEGRPFQ